MVAPFKYDLWHSEPVRENDIIMVHCFMPNGTCILFNCPTTTTLIEMKEVKSRHNIFFYYYYFHNFFTTHNCMRVCTWKIPVIDESCNCIMMKKNIVMRHLYAIAITHSFIYSFMLLMMHYL